MSRIRSRNTKLENDFTKELRRAGINFRRHPKIYGNPDFLVMKRNIVIFIDGCFWHRCPVHYKEPKSNRNFWIPKIERNAKRDKQVSRILKEEGYKVIRIWEHDIKKDKMIKWVRKIKS